MVGGHNQIVVIQMQASVTLCSIFLSLAAFPCFITGEGNFKDAVKE